MWTKEEFIEKARIVYGNKYDYSKVMYINSSTKVCIVCPIHGEFWVTPSNHIYGKQGCKLCKLEEKRKKFIEDAIKIHGYKYDYSRFIFKAKKNKGIIICPIHGEFWQTPLLHINQKCGCPYCVGKYKTSEEYIEKVKKIHGDKYDLSEATADTRLKTFYVTCKKCGNRFKTCFDKLLNGQGCKYCSHRSYKYTFEEIAEIGAKVHKGKYIYPEQEYISKKRKIRIICPIHGEFLQTSEKHINEKQGCPLCNPSHKMTTEEFIKKSRKIHGERFSYDKTDLDKRDKEGRVIITCKTHGDFLQTPHGHLSGKGCRKCQEENHVNEMLLYNFIKNNFPKYNVICQYKNKFLGEQVLDIFIENLNVGIEYQGIQHFEPVKYFGGKEKYEYTVKMDKLKKEKCDNNNVKLFYFSKEKKIPKEYLDTIYSNNNELLNEIKKYDNN